MGLKFGLNLGDGGLLNLEGFSQNVGRNIRVRPKHCICNGDDARVLAAESGESHGGSVPDVLLEVNETHRKNKHIALVKHFGEETILGVGGDEADEECAFEDGENLGGARVRVGRVDPPGSIVDTSQGDAERVEARDLHHIDSRHSRAHWGGRVGCFVKPTEEEIIRSHKLRVLAHHAVHFHCQNHELHTNQPH